MSAKRNIIGQRFTRLFAREEGPPKIGPSGIQGRTTVCDCDCGNVVIVRNACLTSGATKSCGCLHRDVIRSNTKHGFSTGGKPQKIYRVWSNMKNRCCNPNTDGFSGWGGRGITVCKWWMDFRNFRADMGEGKRGWTIERVDNDGNYSCGHCQDCVSHQRPMNCVWATRTRQTRNRRSNHIFTVRGETGCLPELCEHFGVKYNMVRNRLGKGWPIERAIFEPLHSQGARRTVPP